MPSRTRSYSRQADKIELKILLLVIDQNIQFSAVLSQGTALFKQFLSIAKAFLGKHYYIVV